MKRFQRRILAFTLIELLIVVAIIAILAAIAVPNFLEAQIRSKVSRVKADIRSLATAIEAYRVDNNGYPDAFKAASTGFYNNRLMQITTPVAYITTLPVDVFRAKRTRFPDPPQQERVTFEYVNRAVAIGAFAQFSNRDSYRTYFNGDPEWFMMSPGPVYNYSPFDSDDGGAPIKPWPWGSPINAVPANNRRKVHETYDASNGTISVGGIWRTQIDSGN